jgi:hypothetical protein
MAVLAIPTTADPYYAQKTRLDGRDFILHFSYNQREDRFYLALHDDEDAPILHGIKLVANWPLLRGYRWNTALPPGELFVASLIGNDPPGLNELGPGKRCQLIYRPFTAPPPAEGLTPWLIYMAFTIVPSGSYSGDEAFVALVVEKFQVKYAAARSLDPVEMASYAKALTLGGVLNATLAIGRSAGSLSSAVMTISSKAFAVFGEEQTTVAS